MRGPVPTVFTPEYPNAVTIPLLKLGFSPWRKDGQSVTTSGRHTSNSYEATHLPAEPSTARTVRTKVCGPRAASS